ncbi:hypothetical protein ABFS82_01G043500 [Erythranthe guttata]
MADTSNKIGKVQDPTCKSDDIKIREFLERKIEEKEEQILKMEASVFQLANYYFVFQGVMLTAIINGSSSTLKCRHFWLPFCLSLIGAVLNIGTLLTIADKYKEALIQLDERTLIFYQHVYPKTFKRMHIENRKKKTWRNTIMVISMILFFLFALLNLIASWIIPCRI